MTTLKDLGDEAYHNKKYDVSLQYYLSALKQPEKAIKQPEKNKYIIYSNIASVYIKKNNLQKSLDYIIKSIKDNMNWFKTWKKLGYILELQKKMNHSYIAYKRSYDLLITLNENYPKIKKELEYKIKKIEDGDMSEDTESETEVLDTTSENFRSNMFEKMIKNEKIVTKLNDEKLQKKILDNQFNPFIIFKDNELMEIMNEMYSEFKRK